MISSINSNETNIDMVWNALDSHANMVAAGKHSVIFYDTGKTCTINAFAKSTGKLENVQIVDAIIAYNCPYQCKTFVLLLRNLGHIPKFDIDLLPPFILRGSKIQIDKCP